MRLLGVFCVLVCVFRVSAQTCAVGQVVVNSVCTYNDPALKVWYKFEENNPKQNSGSLSTPSMTQPNTLSLSSDAKEGYKSTSSNWVWTSQSPSNARDILSISLWMKQNILQSTEILYYSCESDIWIKSTATATENVLSYKTAGSNGVYRNFYTVAVNQWSHIVVTYNYGTKQVYVNGILKDTVTNTHVPYGEGCGMYNWVNGLVDDVRVYSRILTAQEAMWLYKPCTVDAPFYFDTYVCPCGAGYVSVNNACVACETGKFAAAGATACTNCPAGTYSAVAGASACTACPSTFTSLPGSLTAANCGCGQNFYNMQILVPNAQRKCGSDGNQVCSTSTSRNFPFTPERPASYAVDGDVNTVAWLIHSENNKWNTYLTWFKLDLGVSRVIAKIEFRGAFTPWGADKFQLIQVGDIDEVDANPGCFSRSYSNSPTTCGSSCQNFRISGVGTNACGSCSGGTPVILTGRYVFVRSVGQYLYCDPMTWQNDIEISELEVTYYGDSCAACPVQSSTPFSMSPKSISDCKCNIGYTGPDGGVCTACVAGKFKDVTGNTSCLDCPVGKSSVVGASAESVCVNIVCAAGRYLSGSNCIACPPGAFSGVTGASSANTCVQCPAGAYSTTAGASACASCPAGASSVLGSTSIANCVCNAGFYGANGGACTACASTFTSLPGSLTAADCVCPLNQYTAYSDILNIQRQCGVNNDQRCSSTQSADKDTQGTQGGIKDTVSLWALDGWLATANHAVSINGNTWLRIDLGRPRLISRFQFILSGTSNMGQAWRTESTNYYAVQIGDIDALDANPICAIGMQDPRSTAAETKFCVKQCLSIDMNTRSGTALSQCRNSMEWQPMTGRFVYIRSANPDDLTMYRSYDLRFIEIEITSVVVTGCTTCPVQSSVPFKNTTKYVYDCKCNLGYTGVDGSACTGCVAGTFKSVSGSSPCTGCLAGLYSSTVGANASTVCTTCPAATYSNVTSASACTACRVGQTSLPGSLTDNACGCGENSYNELGSTIPNVQWKCGSNENEACSASQNFGYSPANNAIDVPNTPDPLSTRTDANHEQGCPWWRVDLGVRRLVTSFLISAYDASDLEVQIGDMDSVNANPTCGKWLDNQYETSFWAYSGEYNGYLNYLPKTLSCTNGNMFGRYFFIRQTLTWQGIPGRCDIGRAFSLYFVRISAIDIPCTVCPTGTSNTFSNNLKLFSTCWCAPGSYYASSSCVLCVSGKFWENGQCSNCPNNTYSNMNGALNCSTCLSRFGSHAGSSVCQCAAGYRAMSDGDCALCESGKFKNFIGSTNCTSCAAGTYTSGVGATACLTCTANAHSGMSSTECRCNAGATGNGSVCVLCGAGKYKGVTGNESCADCPANSYSGVVGSSVVTVCTCNTGASGPNGGACDLCVPGKYKTVTGTSVCLNCSANTFSAVIGATSVAACSSCPANSQSGGSSAACVCNKGYTGPDGGPCLACVAGTFKTEIGSAECTLCDANTFSVVVGSTNASVCQACQAKAIAVAGSVGQEYCYCEPGYAHLQGRHSCRDCAPGTYNSQLGQRACSNCSIGMFSVNWTAVAKETCQSCQAGKWSPEGSANCNLCPANSKTLNVSGLITDCVCDPGYVGPGGSTCVGCAAGLYKDVAGPEGCVSCPALMSSFVGTARETDCWCVTGYIKVAGVCVRMVPRPVEISGSLEDLPLNPSPAQIQNAAENLRRSIAAQLNVAIEMVQVDRVANTTNVQVLLFARSETEVTLLQGKLGLATAAPTQTSLPFLLLPTGPASVGEPRTVLITVDIHYAARRRSRESEGMFPVTTEMSEYFDVPVYAISYTFDASGSVEVPRVIISIRTSTGEEYVRVLSAAQELLVLGNVTLPELRMDLIAVTDAGPSGLNFTNALIRADGSPMSGAEVEAAKQAVIRQLSWFYNVPEYDVHIVVTANASACVDLNGTSTCFDPVYTVQVFVEANAMVSTETLQTRYPLMSPTVGTPQPLVLDLPFELDNIYYYTDPGDSDLYVDMELVDGDGRFLDDAEVAQADEALTWHLAEFFGVDASRVHFEIIAPRFPMLSNASNVRVWIECGPEESAHMLDRASQLTATATILVQPFKLQGLGAVVQQEIHGQMVDGRFVECQPNFIVDALACKCKPGYRLSSTACIPCEGGTYSTALDATECTACEAATFSAAGATACASCHANSNASAGSSSQDACQCNPGFFFLTLVENGLGYNTAANQYCLPCVNGSYKNDSGNFNCSACEVSDYSLDAVSCDSCNYGYGRSGSNDSNTSVCVSCPPGSFTAAPGNGACAACPADTFSNVSTVSSCEKCPLGYRSLPGTIELEDCCALNSAPEQSDTLLCLCNAGYTGPDAGEAKGQCNACLPGTYKDSNGAANCTRCSVGTYSPTFAADSNTCAVCAAGQYAPEASANCTVCPANSAAPAGSGFITNCLCNFGFTGPNGGACVACLVGTYKDSSGAANCTGCPLNSNSSDASTDITDCFCDPWCSGPDGGPCVPNKSTLNETSGEYQCSPGYTGPDRTGPCVTCALGKYKNVPGPVPCSLCAPGQYQDAVAATGCSSCAPDSFSNESGTEACTQCPAGFRALSGTTTIQDCCALNSAPFSANSTIGCSCNTGYTGPDAGPSKGQCSACLPGTYKDSNGTANCTSCPLNSNSSAASGDITDCACDAWCNGPPGGPCIPKNSTLNATSGVYQCSPGYTGPDRTGPCVACVVGTSKNVSGSVACSFCAPGQYQDALATRSCSSCAPDTFQNASGASVCATCPAGFKALQGTTAVQDCCKPNSSPQRITECTALKNLAMSCGTGGTQGCPVTSSPYWYYPGTGISYVPERANDGLFVDGYVSESGGREGPPPTFWRVDFQREFVITSVKIWAHGPPYGNPIYLANFALQLSNDGVSFINCATGQYGSTTGALISTHTCLGTGRYLRVALPWGYLGLNEVQVYGVPDACWSTILCPCNTGYTGPDAGASKGQCAICPSGTYKATNGSAACTGCAANSNSSAGSMIVTSCSCNAGYTGPNGGPCVACDAGKFKNASGTAACDVCAANTYSASGVSVCTACAVGFTSPAGSTLSSDCCDPNTTFAKNVYDALSTTTKTTMVQTSRPTYVVRVSSVPVLSFWDGRAEPAIPPAYISSGGYNGHPFLRFSKISSVSGLSYLPTSMILITSSGITVVTVVRFMENIKGAFWSMHSDSERLLFEINLSDALQMCVFSQYISNMCTDTAVPINVWLKVSYTYNPSAWPRQILNIEYLSTTGATVVLSKTSTSVISDGNYGLKSAIGYSASTTCASRFNVMQIQNRLDCDRPNFDLAGFYFIQSFASDADIAVLLKAIAIGTQIYYDRSDTCQCNAGFGGTGRSNCASCAPGTYKSEIRTGSCSLCVANTYSTAVQQTNVSTCVSCPNNSVSVPGRFECECNFGYQGDMFNCAACVPGKFKRFLGTSSCMDCPANTEAPGTAWKVCASLPGYNGLGYALDDVARSCGASLSATCPTLSNGATSNAAGGADGALDASAGTSVSVVFSQNLARSCGATGTSACATTAGSAFRPWWGVDFGRSRSVFAVNVMSTNWANTRDFKVVVGDVPDAQSPLNAVCADYLVGTGSGYVKFTCEDTVSGRYLYVVNGPHAANSLILSDVTVDAFNYAANASLMLPWWAVDFEVERAVSGLVIQAQASSVIQVRVGHSTDPLQNAICAQNRTLVTVGNNNITCSSAMLGRYLSVIGTGNTLLVLNDVRVLGAPTAPCAAGTYKPLVGNHNCTACPALSTSVVGATSLAQCSCRAGYLDVWS